MSARSQPILVRMSGSLALFTRPEMKVERVTYDVITPSAARGILEAVLWKPGMRWMVQRITVLKPVRHICIKRNEVGSKIPSDFTRWTRLNQVDRDFFADDDRQQRNAAVLRDVDYVVEAVIELTTRAGPDDSIAKFVAMFRRRLENGQHFHQPYFGCREFPAMVTLGAGTERPDQELIGHEADLGWMLHDIEYNAGGPKQPRFFHARLKDGVVEIPPFPEGVPR